MSEYTPTYAIGEKVQARFTYAHTLVAGETYTVVGYTAPVQVDAFRFPEYIAVEDAKGVRSSWYPWRFKRIT